MDIKTLKEKLQELDVMDDVKILVTYGCGFADVSDLEVRPDIVTLDNDEPKTYVVLEIARRL